MSGNGANEIWTAPRLAARLAALRGLAPAPSCYVVWRATTQPNEAEIAGYELPGEPGRWDEQVFEQWLTARDLAGPERLSVSVLVIREHLDETGLLREGVLERRRGGVDGPFYGKAARVEFTGAATRVRRYQALRDGRLAELPPDDDAGAPPPSDDPESESFAGEDAAVHAFLGEGTIILDRRPPSLFEDLLGLSGIIHARKADGGEVGCGVGWHGTMAYVLAAEFPRHGGQLLPPPELEAAVKEVSRTQGLIPHETRLDEQGFCVIAQRRGRQTLVAIRLDGTTTRVEAYLPSRNAASTEDQRRWMIYAETYEGRIVLDSWRNGESDEISVLTADQDQEAWRHTVDADGIELSRRSDNEAAAAVLFRERANPPPATSLFDTESDASEVASIRHEATDEGGGTEPIANDAAAPEFPAPADSLLTKVRAYLRVTALLRAVTVACGTGKRTGRKVPKAALDQLRALAEPLAVLNAVFAMGSLRRLTLHAESGTMNLQGFATALDDLVTRLRDELALTRIVLLPSAQTVLDGDPPFGPMVEVRFPSAAYDIEEAVHCLALRRTTAAVLHAMKVMRHGLHGVEHLLKTPPLTDLTWARMIVAVRAAAGDRHELVELLDRVRRAWRRSGLMPADKYTEEEAETVLEAVAAFMRTLAACFDASGEPLTD
jgi:hypothetical protein